MQNEIETKYVAPSEYCDMLIQKVNEAIAAYSVEVLKGNGIPQKLSEYGTMIVCANKLHQFKQQEYWRHIELNEFKSSRVKTSENPI